jgi:hypothetical protein
VKNFFKNIAVKKYSNLSRMITILDRNFSINFIHAFHKLKTLSSKHIPNQKLLNLSNRKSTILKKMVNDIIHSKIQRKRRPSKSDETSFEKSFSLTKSLNYTSTKKPKAINLSLTKNSHQRVHTINNSPDNIFNRLYQVKLCNQRIIRSEK